MTQRVQQITTEWMGPRPTQFQQVVKVQILFKVEAYNRLKPWEFVRHRLEVYAGPVYGRFPPHMGDSLQPMPA
ncbi:MAG: hypothetical protein JRI84_05250 [Deltaproteobacteria bacterium]|nr:hypothetical protein [Deltaproteobacteria bacterium]